MAILLASAVLFASGYSGPDPVIVGEYARPNGYPTCINRPTGLNEELTGPINVYLVWENNSSHPWTTANQNYIRAFFNGAGNSTWGNSLRQYPDQNGNVPGATTVAAECTDAEAEGNFCDCIGGSCVGFVVDNLVGGGGASGCSLPIDPHGVYFVLPSWSDFSVSGSCHASASNVLGSGKTVVYAAVDYTVLTASGLGGGPPYGAQWGTTSVFNSSSFTQPSTGNSVSGVQLNSTAHMAVGEPVELVNSSTSQTDYYTLSAVNTGTNQVTLANNYAPLGSGDSGGTTIGADSFIQDLSGTMLPSLVYDASHELVEAITNPVQLGWTCPGTCSNAPFTSCVSSAGCTGGGTCLLPAPSGEDEVMDVCESAGPYGYSYPSTVATPTWTGTGNTGDSANWGVTVGSTHYDFPVNAIAQGFAGLTAGYRICAASFVPVAGGYCNTGSDCDAPDGLWSNRCVSHVCVTATCSDGILDGDESAVDCGGYCASGIPGAVGGACAATKACHSNVDCASGSCTAGVCN